MIGIRGRETRGGSPLFSKTAHRRIVMSASENRRVTSARATRGGFADMRAKSILISAFTQYSFRVPGLENQEEFSKERDLIVVKLVTTPAALI